MLKHLKMETNDTRWVLLEEGKPHTLLLTEEEAKRSKLKFSEMYPHLDYTIFYDEYYEFSEYY
jgi:hypothetical protein